jgi:hypothetical protein
MLGALAIGIVVFVWWQLGHPGYRKRSGAAPGHLAVGSAVGPAVGSAVGPAVSSSESDPRAAAGAGDLATTARADDRGTGDEAPRLRSDPT